MPARVGDQLTGAVRLDVVINRWRAVMGRLGGDDECSADGERDHQRPKNNRHEVEV
jgi:hypothetical protein